MEKIVIKIISIVLIIGVILCVGLAIAACIFNELLLIYQCSILSTHLLLMTYIMAEVCGEHDTNIKE